MACHLTAFRLRQAENDAAPSAIVARRPRIVGGSSTFQEHAASLGCCGPSARDHHHHRRDELRVGDGHGDASGVSAQHRLDGIAARLDLACDEATERRALREQFGGIDDVVESLIASQLLLDFDGRLLALAVEATRPRPTTMPNPGGSLALSVD